MIWFILGLLLYATLGAYVAYRAVLGQYLRRLSFLEWLMVVFTWPWVIAHVKREDRARRRRTKSLKDYLEEFEDDR